MAKLIHAMLASAAHSGEDARLPCRAALAAADAAGYRACHQAGVCEMIQKNGMLTGQWHVRIDLEYHHPSLK